MITILEGLLIALLLGSMITAFIIVWACCAVSSRCSREEEENAQS